MAPVSGSLGRRLALVFAVVAALTAGLVAVILSLTWARQFEVYIEEQLQSTADGASRILATAYQEEGGWTLATFAEMPRFGVMSGLAVQVLTPDGSLLYDDSFHGSVMAQQMGASPPSGYREPDGPVVASPVVVSDEVVGVVRVWSLSPQGLLTENDIRFQRASFIALAIAAFAAVALASGAGLLFAMQLSRPIDRITETAAAVRSGDRGARTGLAGDDAIGALGRTFDEMADAIEADREMERRLTADVAHELRTPLQAIQATVEAMQDGVLPADEERLGTVRDETRRLARLADGILELTRLERGTVEMEMAPVDLADVVSTAIDSHRMLIEAAALLLREDIERGLVVNGDRDRLTQAVGNLIANAARYTPEGGEVSVVTRRDGDRAVVEVADTGIGISEENLDKVFRRFWRADDARHRASGGLGIGLAVVREIAERHGGTVTVSRREGAGSVFAIALPLR